MLNNGNIINTSSVSVRKIFLESVGLFNEGRNFIAWEDFDLWLRLAKVNIRFKRLSKFLGFSLYGYKNVTNPKTKLMTAVNFSKIYFPNFSNHNLPAWNITTGAAENWGQVAEIYYDIPINDGVSIKPSIMKTFLQSDKTNGTIVSIETTFKF